MAEPRFQKGALRIHYLDHNVAVTLRSSIRSSALREAHKYLYDCGIIPRPKSREEESALLGRIRVSRVRTGEPIVERLQRLAV